MKTTITRTKPKRAAGAHTQPMTRGRPTKSAETERLQSLRTFSTALYALALKTPDRLTVSQLSFFLFAGMADRAGRAMTFTEIREALGGDLGKSLHTTYKIFLDGSRSSDREKGIGLNWLETETDPKDHRRKFIKLTRKGRDVLNALVHDMDAAGGIQ